MCVCRHVNITLRGISQSLNFNQTRSCDRWSSVHADAGDVLSEIMEHQTLATVKGTKLSEEERANKQAILAQYAQVSEGEEYPSRVHHRCGQQSFFLQRWPQSSFFGHRV